MRLCRCVKSETDHRETSRPQKHHSEPICRPHSAFLVPTAGIGRLTQPSRKTPLPHPADQAAAVAAAHVWWASARKRRKVGRRIRCGWTVLSG